MPKDEYGVDYDEDVEKALKDPKGGLLAKCFDYLTKREAAKNAKEAAERDAEQKKKPKSMFDGLFD